MNPIEHWWDDLDRRLRSRQSAPQTLQKLQQALEQEWERILQDHIRRLIESKKLKKISVGKGSLLVWTYDRMFRLLHGTGKVVGRIR